MTPEQKREQLLKRLLPALALLVVYFTFVSNIFVTKSKKAQSKYDEIAKTGINSKTLDAKLVEQGQLQAEIAKLEQEETEIRNKLKLSYEFFSNKKNQNATMDKIAAILANNHLQILSENRNVKFNTLTFSRSIIDTQDFFKEFFPVSAPSPAPPNPNIAPAPNNNADATVTLWSFHFIGSYNNCYQALKTLLTDNISMLPVSLTMQTQTTANGKKQLEWHLMLWL